MSIDKRWLKFLDLINLKIENLIKIVHHQDFVSLIDTCPSKSLFSVGFIVGLF